MADSKKISELNDGAAELSLADITVIVQSGETRKVALSYILGLLGFPIVFMDVLDCSSNPNYPAASKGQMWLCTAGKVGGADGKKVENGEMIICKVASSPEGDYATVGVNWADYQTNIDVDLYALNAEVFHNNIEAEINALVEKTDPANADILLIEDSAISPAYTKKKITWANVVAKIRSVLGMTYLKFTGATSSEKTLTIPDADAVVITNQRNEVTGFTEKTTPVDADILPIEDSESAPTFQKKKLTWANLVAKIRSTLGITYLKFAGTSTSEKTLTVPDANATVITNQPAEISALTEKAVPVAADLIMIEDSADSPVNTKKKAQVSKIVESIIHNATPKESIVDNDEMGLIDSEASNVIKKTLWSTIKSVLKNHFDTLYNLYVLPIASAGTLGGIKVGSRLSIDGDGVLSADSQAVGGDEDAIHLTEAAEIDSLDEKVTPANDDLLVIEDSADSPAYSKKKLKWSNVVANVGGWRKVAAADFTARPSSTSVIDLLRDLTSEIQVGMSLKYVWNGTTYYGQVKENSSSPLALTVQGAPLSTDYDVTELYYSAGKINILHFFVQGLFAAYNDTAALLNQNNYAVVWDKEDAYVVNIAGWIKGQSSRTVKPKVNLKIGSNEVGSTSGGVTLTGQQTWYRTLVDIDPTKYKLVKGDALELYIRQGYTEANSDKFAGLGAGVSSAPYDDEAWSGATNIYTDNASYASSTGSGFDTNDYTHLLKASTFAHAIPSTAIIYGIEVIVERYGANGAAVDGTIRLSKDNSSAVGDDKKDTENAYPASPTIKTYGSPTDLWGTTWTPAEINSANFAVWIAAQATGDDADVYIDYVKTKVYYRDYDDAEDLSVQVAVLTP